MYTLIHKYKR